MTEATETHVVTDLPVKKQPRIRNPFAKKNESSQDATETPRKKGPHGIYTAGLLLVGAGAVAAVASKLGKKDGADSENPDSVESTDN